MKRELVNPGGVQPVISRQLGSAETKIRCPRGPRVGPYNLTGQVTPRQAGNKIADMQSREGLKLLAFAMKRLSGLRKAHGGSLEPVALNPVLLQGSPGHLPDCGPTYTFQPQSPPPHLLFSSVPEPPNI